MRCTALLLALAVAGCGSSGPFDLELTFPDEAARASCASLHVWVLEPGEGAACAALQAGTAQPGDPGYALEAELAFAHPPTGELPRLPAVGPGLRLFYAEGEDGYGQVFLAGCTPDEAGSDGAARVRIALVRLETCTPTGPERCNGLDDDCDGSTDEGTPEALCPAAPRARPQACTAGTCSYACDPGWFDTSGTPADGCECRQTRGGTEWCDGLDNDCDGAVDGPGCQGCATDEECASPADCLAGTCQAGTCATTPTGDGSACDDLDPCTSQDTCLDGLCAGSAYTCDDGLFCNGLEACDGLGGCQNAGPPCLTPCMQACDEAADRCGPDGPGTDCDDGVACTGEDACDGDGACRGEPIAGFCGASEACLPGCATDAIGCVRRPDFLVLDCPAEGPAASPAECNLRAGNAEGTEGCASCTVTLLPSVLDTVSFGACDPGAWSLEETGCATHTGCELDADDERACCQSLTCSNAPGGLLAQHGACGDQQNGWRLSKSFDFQPFERARFCLELAQLPDGGGATLQLQVDRGDDPTGTLVSCYPPRSFDHEIPARVCSDLPLSVTALPQTRLTVRAEVHEAGHAAVLGNGALYAFPPECAEEVEIMRTRFAGCDPAAGEPPGWVFSGGDPACATGEFCGAEGGLVLGSIGPATVPQLSAGYSLTGPHANIRLPAELCWKQYTSPGFQGSYRFTLSGGGGGVWYVVLYESQVEWLLWEGACREVCVDLSWLGGNLWGSQNLNLGLQGDDPGGGGGLLINDVVLRSSRECPATGVFELSPIDTSAIPAVLQLQDLLGQPRRARISCTWGEDGPSAYDEIELR